MKSRVALKIETRDEGECCSYRCPQFDYDGSYYECGLFGRLERPMGGRAARRHPECLTAEIPLPDRLKRAKKSTGPTVWDRIGSDKL